MNKIELKNWVEKNPKLVKMRESVNYPGLFVLKYSKTVFYKNLWNRFLEECRGTVIDKDFNLISRPFTKVYNYGIEKQAPKLSDDTVVDAYRKINGFMVSVTWHDGDILVSTTGSLDSDFCAMARELIDVGAYREICRANPRLTFMFECVHRNDPHIIPEEEGMYLIGYRLKEWDSPVKVDSHALAVFGIQFGCLPVEGFRTTVGDLRKAVKTVRHEGFVAYTESGDAFKIKSPYYLVKKALSRKKDIMNLNKTLVNEEFYPLVTHLSEIKDQFNEMDEQSRLEYIRSFLNN